jgi:hypothetical protein
MLEANTHVSLGFAQKTAAATSVMQKGQSFYDSTDQRTGTATTRTWARGVSTTDTYTQGLLTLTNYGYTTSDVAITYDAYGCQPTVTQTNQSRIA